MTLKPVRSLIINDFLDERLSKATHFVGESLYCSDIDRPPYPINTQNCLVATCSEDYSQVASLLLRRLKPQKPLSQGEYLLFHISKLRQSDQHYQRLDLIAEGKDAVTFRFVGDQFPQFREKRNLSLQDLGYREIQIKNLTTAAKADDYASVHFILSDPNFSLSATTPPVVRDKPHQTCLRCIDLAVVDRSLGIRFLQALRERDDLDEGAGHRLVETPLHVACSERYAHHSDRAHFQELVRGSPDLSINLIGKDGWRPIEMAVRSAFGEGLKILMQDPRCQLDQPVFIKPGQLHSYSYVTLNGEVSLLELAVERNHLDTVKLLLKNPILRQQHHLKRPSAVFVIAARNKNPNMISLLSAYEELDVNAKFREQTALEVAYNNQDWATYEALRKHPKIIVPRDLERPSLLSDCFEVLNLGSYQR